MKFVELSKSSALLLLSSAAFAESTSGWRVEQEFSSDATVKVDAKAPVISDACAYRLKLMVSYPKENYTTEIVLNQASGRYSKGPKFLNYTLGFSAGGQDQALAFTLGNILGSALKTQLDTHVFPDNDKFSQKCAEIHAGFSDIRALSLGGSLGGNWRSVNLWFQCMPGVVPATLPGNLTPVNTIGVNLNNALASTQDGALKTIVLESNCMQPTSVGSAPANPSSH